MTSFKKFEFADIATMDEGAIGIAVDRMIRSAIEDCDDRPTVKTARKVTVEIEIIPRPDGKHLRDITIGFQLGCKIPKKKSLAYTMLYRQDTKTGGCVIFNPETGDAQSTFGFDGAKE